MISVLSISRAALTLSVLATVASGCAQPPPEAAVSGSSVPKASTAPDIAGGGGAIDEVYRQIYTPGNPEWSNQ